MKVLLANPRGFCAGVDRAIEIVEKALDYLGPPVYVRHEVVHNRLVVERLRKRGAVFVNELAEVPASAQVIFSAHGVSRSVVQEARERQLKVLDATCPLVTRVHLEVSRYCQKGLDVILIGHRGHPEVEGTMGQYDTSQGGRIHLVETVADVSEMVVDAPEKLAYVTQTTLSVDDTAKIVRALKEKFPSIVGPRKDDICYATQNRQDAVKRLAKCCDRILIVGSKNSSNSNRLCEIAVKNHVPARLIDNAAMIDEEWLSGSKVLGISAGASAPESLVRDIVQTLYRYGAVEVKEESGVKESVIFPIPLALRSPDAQVGKVKG